MVYPYIYLFIYYSCSVRTANNVLHDSGW